MVNSLSLCHSSLAFGGLGLILFALMSAVDELLSYDVAYRLFVLFILTVFRLDCS